MDAKKQAVLEVILAALAVREEDGGVEFPDELHARMIDAALSTILQPVEIVCHFD